MSAQRDPASFPLPEALVVGPQKTGTTWIHRYLESRGEVRLPAGVKETFFFDRRFSRGLDWYARHFERSRIADPVRTVEVAPTYFQERPVPERVRDTLGDVRIVVTLRDPVRRTHSLYVQYLRYGVLRAGFREALRRCPEIVDGSRYATHLRRWWECFGRSRVAVLFQEDLAGRPEAFVRQLDAHLGLPFRGIPASVPGRVNVASLPPSRRLARLGLAVADFLRDSGHYGVVNAAKALGLKSLFFGVPGRRSLPPLLPEDHEELLKELLPEIEALERMLGRDLSAWKELPAGRASASPGPRAS